MFQVGTLSNAGLPVSRQRLHFILPLPITIYGPAPRSTPKNSTRKRLQAAQAVKIYFTGSNNL
jgi:hypothetical protein